ncbi:MAG: cyclic nucleotide-binding domain-containing protein [Treponema sp.]|jgi:CRP-like cAMP-binding protein|nr:cyclic nucleotide-binding domain-containing protein [Treponema sp.]
MPKTLQFRAGSVIYFKGDPADKVYILQSGMVNLVYQDMETGDDMHDMVQQGEFFGVKSALGRYAREENAVSLKDSTVMVFSIPEFEQVATTNTRIVLKMLTVFSTQLRRVHRQLAILLKTDEQNPEAGLFSVGEYYLRQKRYEYAQYVFNRYLAYYPSGKNSAAVAANLEQVERALGSGATAGPGAAEPSPKKADPSAAYYEALNLMTKEKYQQAYLAFKQIEETHGQSEWAAKSAFEIGRCLYTLNKFAECVHYYTGMLARYPRHPDLRETVFYIGQSNERLGKKEQAIAFYKKVLSMGAPEGDAVALKAKRALKDLED